MRIFIPLVLSMFETKNGCRKQQKFYIDKVATKEGVPEWPLTDKSKRGGKINEIHR